VQRILEPGQIEALAQRSIPRVRLPDRGRIFASRAQRLQVLADSTPAIASYLRLMAALAEAQHRSLATDAAALPGPEQIAQARRHGMPVAQANAWPRDGGWRRALAELCATIAGAQDLPPEVRGVCEEISRMPAERLEAEADALLGASDADVNAATAPFLMAALQVVWVELASRLPVDDGAGPIVPGVCPTCGSLPVASIVRSEAAVQGYRYLHCGLCATEWHLVRVTCSHCESTRGISYQGIEGGSEAVRAECCDECKTYRKILYQEKDTGVEPVADDLASLALDLLLAEAGYHRGSGNPLLWQP
jgi:FdhE protein